MKKLIFFSLVAVILVACDGCEPISPPIEKFTISGFAGPHGTISPAMITVEKGKSATFKIIPDSGYVIESLKDDGIMLPPLDTYTIKNISENNTFEVKFKYKYDEGTLEWYFTRFIWVESSWISFLNGQWYDFTDDSMKSTFSYNYDGTYVQLWNNRVINGTWHFDKTTNPITFVASSRYPEKIEFCDSTKMVLSFIEVDSSTTKITYINNGKRRYN